MTVIRDNNGKLIAHISSGTQDPSIPTPEEANTDVCPHCREPLEVGYGMAGGGMGTYFYCDIHGIICKEQDGE